MVCRSVRLTRLLAGLLPRVRILVRWLRWRGLGKCEGSGQQQRDGEAHVGIVAFLLASAMAQAAAIVLA